MEQNRKIKKPGYIPVITATWETDAGKYSRFNGKFKETLSQKGMGMFLCIKMPLGGKKGK